MDFVSPLVPLDDIVVLVMDFVLDVDVAFRFRYGYSPVMDFVVKLITTRSWISYRSIVVPSLERSNRGLDGFRSRFGIGFNE